jgi:hypothetical protein
VELGNVSQAFLSFPYCHFKKLPPIPWDELRNTLDICLSSKYCSPHPKKHWVDFLRAPYTTNFLFVKGGHFEKHNAHSCELFILKNAYYYFMFYPTVPIWYMRKKIKKLKICPMLYARQSPQLEDLPWLGQTQLP